MAAVYATVDDITKFGRKLTAEEQDKAAELLPVASSKLRLAAKKRGRDLDMMIFDDPDVGQAAREITVKAVIRAIDSSADSNPPAVQASQAALGYSVTGTYLTPGGGLFIKKSELARLGLRRQKYGVMDLYGYDQGNNDQTV